MKEVEAGHCPDLFAVFVLHDAHHAFLECFILLSFQEISSDLPLRQCLYNGFWYHMSRDLNLAIPLQISLLNKHISEESLVLMIYKAGILYLSN